MLVQRFRYARLRMGKGDAALFESDYRQPARPIMQGHSDDWIENRILRSLGKRGLPDGRIVFGRDSFGSLPFDVRNIADAGSVGRPVVAFIEGEQVWTLLGTDAVYCKRYNDVVHLKLDNVRELSLVGNTLGNIDAICTTGRVSACSRIRPALEKP